MTPTKSHYPNGQLECEGFVNGEVQVGNWTFYHENGNVFSKGQYDDNGNPIGIWTEYYENGQIRYEAISSQGNWFSLDADNLEIINYWNEDGIPRIVDGEGKLITQVSLVKARLIRCQSLAKEVDDMTLFSNCSKLASTS